MGLKRYQSDQELASFFYRHGYKASSEFPMFSNCDYFFSEMKGIVFHKAITRKGIYRLMELNILSACEIASLAEEALLE